MITDSYDIQKRINKQMVRLKKDIKPIIKPQTAIQNLSTILETIIEKREKTNPVTMNFSNTSIYKYNKTN